MSEVGRVVSWSRSSDGLTERTTDRHSIFAFTKNNLQFCECLADRRQRQVAVIADM